MDAQHLIADRYSLAESLAGSATGPSWRAVDHWSDRPVVINRVPVSRLASDELLRARQEIAREVRVLGGLRHDRLAPPVDMVLDEGDLWVVSEPLPGVTMAGELARRGVVGLQEAVRWGRDVADGLAVAHGAGALHRNLHAGVVGITEDGRAVVGGFAATVLTPEGLRNGVPVHVAPEVAGGAFPSPAADVFALGVMLYIAVEGRDRLPAAMDRGHPLGAPLMRMLDPDPAQRPSAAAVADQLRQLCEASAAGEPAIRWSAATEMSAARGTSYVGSSPTITSGPPSAPAPPGSVPAGARPYGGPSSWAAPPAGPVIPQPRGPDLPPPVTDPPAARQNRTRWIVAAAVMAVLALAGGLLVGFWPSQTSSSPAAPPPPPSPIGDPRTADPCSLLNVSSVQRFGRATMLSDTGYPHSCVITIATGGQGYVDLSSTFAASKVGTPAGVPERYGDLTIYRETAVKERCDRAVMLGDRSLVYIETTAFNGATTDLCAIADAGTQTAVSALSGGGLPRREITGPANALTGLEVCSLLDQAALGRVPGLDASRRDPGFAGWMCIWGDNPAFVDEPRVRVAVRRVYVLKGQRVPIGGRSAQVSPGGSDNPGSCQLYLVQRSYTGTSGEPRVELLQFTVALGAQQSSDVACQSAKALAEAAAPKLPPA